MAETQQREEMRMFLAQEMINGTGDKQLAIKFTQMYGLPMTVDQVRHFRDNELRKYRRRIESVEKTKDELPDDQNALNSFLSDLMERIEEGPSNREVVALIKEARQVIMTKHELAANADPGKSVFVIQINGEEVASNRQQLLTEDADFKVLPPIDEDKDVE